jgi:hypothetical protein
MLIRGISHLAHIFNHLHTGPDRTADVYGVTLHQTGESLPEEALKHGADVLQYAVEYYTKPDSYCAHYVIGWDGEIGAVADEAAKMSHVGFLPADRQAFLDGSWVNKLPLELVAAWRAHWPHYESPAHVFPGPSPNNVYVGIEMLPLVDGCGFSPPTWLPFGKFTQEQHDSVVALTMDIAQRQQLPDRWHLSARLTTHEDLNPLQRTTKHPPAGWDPGWLRPLPWFDVGWVRMRVAEHLSVSNP